MSAARDAIIGLAVCIADALTSRRASALNSRHASKRRKGEVTLGSEESPLSAESESESEKDRRCGDIPQEPCSCPVGV